MNKKHLVIWTLYRPAPAASGRTWLCCMPDAHLPISSEQLHVFFSI
ncbi:hypothetical protein [Paenibacillus tepidiphilus]|nr:hypothetical protein [Paenibacillus tepidiphilus]